MKYTVHPPPEPLRDYVENLWSIAVDREEPPELTLRFFVTFAPCIVFQHHNGRSAISRRIPVGRGEVSQENHPTAFVRGAITRPFQCIAKGFPAAIGVELKPQALAGLFRIDATEFTDRVVSLNSFSTENFSEQLLNAETEQDQIALLTQFLRKRADASSKGDPVVAEGLRLIHGNRVPIHVRDLLKHLNISERQFERRFRRSLGIPARLYLRITRFHEAVRAMKAGHAERLSDIAYELGYTDQAHFIKDTRALTGYTPKRLSHAIEQSMAMARHGRLLRERILIQQYSCEETVRLASSGGTLVRGS